MYWKLNYAPAYVELGGFKSLIDVFDCWGFF